MPSKLIEKYIRLQHLPHIWCAGCGNGILMQCVVSAIDSMGLDKNNVCIVSGIGCSSRAAGYADFNTMHTTHGRAIAFATGVKMANPKLEVIVITGDGDSSAIGGNHLIHAARRNIGLTVIVFNNNIYGMTGGQFSPTTPSLELATTSPYGNIERNFDIAELANGAGASYTARGNVYHVQKTTQIIEKGIRHQGFSLIDCISLCPTYYGRKNKKGTVIEMMKWQKENCVVANGDKNPIKDESGKLNIGVLSHTNYPEYTKKYEELVFNLKKEKK